MMEEEMKDWINRCVSHKESYSNTVSQVQKLNYKLEEINKVKKSNKNLENEIHEKDKEIRDISIKFKKIKELHKDVLVKIKVHNEEIDKKDGIINNFIDNMKQFNKEKDEVEEEYF